LFEDVERSFDQVVGISRGPIEALLYISNRDAADFSLYACPRSQAFWNLHTG
jgi:hypothetical protein